MTQPAERHPAAPERAAKRQARNRVFSGRWRPPSIEARPFARDAAGVLHIVGKSLPYTVAGYTVRTQSIARATSQIGFRPEIVTRLGYPWSDGHVPPSHREEIEGITHHRLGGPDRVEGLDALLTGEFELMGPLLGNVRPALIHAHSDFKNGLVALALGDLYDLPVVYEVRGFWEETWMSAKSDRSRDARAYRLMREREIECLHRADHVVTLAPTMRDQILEWEVAPEKVTIVPNAVEPDLFPDSSARDPALAENLGIAPERFVVGYVSSLRPLEGIDTMIAAVGQLAASGMPVHCLIVGDGDDRPRLEALTAALGLADRVTFTGAVPMAAVAAHYRQMDVFVVPRRDLPVCRTVQPLKPFEALSSGLPLVMADLPVLRALVEDSEAGVTFEPESVESLASELVGLYRNPRLRSDFGARGAAWVRRHQTWAANGERYRSVYEPFGVRPA